MLDATRTIMFSVVVTVVALFVKVVLTQTIHNVTVGPGLSYRPSSLTGVGGGDAVIFQL